MTTKLLHTARNRPAVSLDHLAFRRDGKTYIQCHETGELFVADPLAVNDIDVAAEQSGLIELLPAVRSSRRAAALVHGSNNTEILRHLEVMHRDFERGVMRSEYRGAQRNQSFDPVLRQTLQLRARMRDFPETLLTGLWIRLRRSMKEECADSRFEQRIDGRVIVARRAIAMAPIQQRRRSAV